MAVEEDLDELKREEENCIFDDSKICPFAYYKEIKQELLLGKYCIPCRIGRSNSILQGLVAFAFLVALTNLILLIYWLSLIS